MLQVQQEQLARPAPVQVRVEQHLIHGQAKLVLLVMPARPVHLVLEQHLEEQHLIHGRVSRALQVTQAQLVLQDPDLLREVQHQTRGQVRQEPLDPLVLLVQMERALDRVGLHRTYGLDKLGQQERPVLQAPLVQGQLQAVLRQILGQVNRVLLVLQEILDRQEPGQTQEPLEPQTQVLQEILDQLHLQRIILPPRYIHIRK